MAVPNYTYLKLKIPDPKGIITVGTTYQRAFECDAECFQFAEALIQSERLRSEPPSEDQEIPESSKRAACSFEPAKDVKDASVTDDSCTLCIGMVLDPK
jgi:predicted RNase H-like HicB family nuclease